MRPSPSFQVPESSLQRPRPPSPCPAHRIRAQGTLSTARMTCTLRGSYVGAHLTRPSLRSSLTRVCDAGGSRQGRLGGQPGGGGVAGGLASGF